MGAGWGVLVTSTGGVGDGSSVVREVPLAPPTAEGVGVGTTVGVTATLQASEANARKETVKIKAR
jgi:hypothetical protein